MPQIQNNAQYDAIYQAAIDRLANQDNFAAHLENMDAGTPLYRYVGYRASLPQAAEAGRTIWTPLANDTQNRWTGNDGNGNGHRGLYLSGEYLDQNVPFPELDHYMDPAQPANNQVYYYDYVPGQEPQMRLADAAELRSMFLFTATEPAQGLNLQLDAGGNHPLLQAILDDARAANPGAFQDGDTLRSLYTAGDDASFCRAIGNAVLEQTDVTYFKTTSVRDGLSSNVIYRAPGPQEVAGVSIDTLRPEGRATFRVVPGVGGAPGRVEGVTTILDLQYNTVFERSGANFDHLLPHDVQVDQLTEVARQMANNLAENYGEMLAVSPPNDAMEAIGVQIQDLQNTLAGGNIEQAITEIGQVRDQIAAQAAPDLAANVRQAFSVVDNAMASLGEITDAIQMAQAPEPPEDVDGIDLTDPTEDQFEPDLNPEHPEGH